MDAITLEHVSKTYGRGRSTVKALTDVNFSAEYGQLVGVIGPSGSGKSTFLSIVGGLLPPTEGDISVADSPYHDLSARGRERLRLTTIGFVLQSYNLVPFLTVRNQFALVDKVKGTHHMDPDRFHGVLKTLGIEQLLDSYPATLSGGQRQRVAIARALYADPTIILADEPTASLDTDHAFQVMGIFRDLAHETDKAIIVVTHDTRLERYADALYEIVDGALSPTESAGSHDAHDESR
ncbi:ABC transporter ATP-binding protein [Bifidobacterium mongoliense]|jgi:putative ABC transport system ATP-binding protein|uniref:Putative hemin import ATP-binding protein HrtA n=4 Tax=Bifidobacterium mongoliense TaxID=518643 RepID=A0A087BU32_9BIFI|nr:ABC transporter ATP-binding protein [Bifidobacterium mongoliense]KFI74532.1 peptide ABC transporter ATP-binding protein [Bifidobacterium mongoliense DSM 21395]MDN5632940.1 ABC transporter ATP-binding protein [Bifidobacterium mongoliense]MDN6024610.1 ABC transporter ATP-binding protein [Bifidobacterium mongoliense]MDN6050478.1 ABC transporter ATP-binding protein [Bifidobacterium mongoliense]MDN6719697.1 ABC transporter ATP-binding protein [Bifidobacterium mongoliense]